MTVLVAVDFSPVTQATLAAVRRAWPADQLTIVVLHVAEPDPAFVGWDTGPEAVRDQVASKLRREKQQVEALAAGLRQDGIDAIGLAVQGPIVQTILSEAARVRADLIAIGSHGHGAAYDLAVGSISAGVIRAATLPVLVTPDSART